MTSSAASGSPTTRTRLTAWASRRAAERWRYVSLWTAMVMSRAGSRAPRADSRGGLFGHHTRHGQDADQNQPVVYDGQHTAGLPEGPGRVAPAQRLHPGPRHGGGQGAVDGPDLLRGVEDESYGDGGAEEVGGDGGRAVPAGLVPEAPCGRKGLPGRHGHSLRRNMDMPHGPPGTWSMTVAGVHRFPWQRTSAAPGNSTTNTRTVNAVWVNAASCCASVSNRYQAFRMPDGAAHPRRRMVRITDTHLRTTDCFRPTF